MCHLRLQHSVSTFEMYMPLHSNSRDVVASSPPFSRPAARAPRRAVSFPEAGILLYSDGGGSGDEIGWRAYSLVNILNVF